MNKLNYSKSSRYMTAVFGFYSNMPPDHCPGTQLQQIDS